jgi:internalin A
VACKPDDDYFRLYYVMRCEILIRNLKEENQEILDIKLHIILIIKESDFFNKSELLVSFEEGGKNVLNYNQYSEYAAYLHKR